MTTHEQSGLTRAQLAEQKHSARMLGQRLQTRKEPPIKATVVSPTIEIENDLGKFAFQMGFADLEKSKELYENVEYKKSLGNRAYSAESFLNEAQEEVGVGFNHVIAKAKVRDFRFKNARKIDAFLTRRDAERRANPVKLGAYGKDSPFSTSSNEDRFTATGSSISVDDVLLEETTSSHTPKTVSPFSSQLQEDPSPRSSPVNFDLDDSDEEVITPKPRKLPTSPYLTKPDTNSVLVDAGVMLQGQAKPGVAFSQVTREGRLTRFQYSPAEIARFSAVVKSALTELYDSCDRAAGEDNIDKLNVVDLPDGNRVEFGFEEVDGEKHLLVKAPDWRGDDIFLEIDKFGNLIDSALFSAYKEEELDVIAYEGLRELVPLMIETANYVATQKQHDGQKLPNLDEDVISLVGTTPILALEDIDLLSKEVWQDHFEVAAALEDEKIHTFEDDNIDLELEEYRAKYSYSASSTDFENFFNNLGKILKSVFDKAKSFVQGFVKSWWGSAPEVEVGMVDEEKRAAFDETRKMFRDLFSEVKEASKDVAENSRGAKSFALDLAHDNQVNCDLYRNGNGEERLVLRIAADLENKNHIVIELDETGTPAQHYVLQPPLPNRDLGRGEFKVLAEVVPQVFAACANKIHARDAMVVVTRPSSTTIPHEVTTLMTHQNQL